jgi:hypothetical protein
MRLLKEIVGRSIILCYREDPAQLVQSLEREGLNPIVQRQVHSPKTAGWTSNVKTFMNHHDAWQRCVDFPDWTLICEADFVPCQGLGSLPAFWPLDHSNAWGYLYQGSPRLLSPVGPERYLRGHTAPLVGYVINSAVARILNRFYDHEMETHDPTKYWAFDSHLQWFAMGQGAEAYIPYTHYGEHGGRPNPEHRLLGGLARAGAHRADNLTTPLAFLPDYAEGSIAKYRLERAKSRLMGFGRLMMGRWISRTNVYPITAADFARMNLLGVRRLLAGGAL